MQAITLECQLAEAQIGRYLSGASLSPAVLQDLEKHIAECERCRNELDARRAQLLNLRQASGRAAGHEASDRLLGRFRLRSKSQPEPGLRPGVAAVQLSGSKLRVRTLALSGGLALVLIVMSALVRAPEQIFGKRVGLGERTAAVVQPTRPISPPKQPTKQPSQAVALTDTKPTSTPGAGEISPAPSKGAAPSPSTPPTVPAAKQPKPVVSGRARNVQLPRRRAAGQPVYRAQSRIKVQKRPVVRIFDPSGKPLRK